MYANNALPHILECTACLNSCQGKFTHHQIDTYTHACTPWSCRHLTTMQTYVQNMLHSPRIASTTHIMLLSNPNINEQKKTYHVIVWPRAATILFSHPLLDKPLLGSNSDCEICTSRNLNLIASATPPESCSGHDLLRCGGCPGRITQHACMPKLH